LCKIQFFVKIIKTFTMIKKKGWSSKIRYYHQSSYRRVPDFANLFHRFKRTMSVLGRVRALETTVSMLLYGASFWKSPNWARCRTSARILISTSKALKHLLKPTLSTVFMDLDSYLNPKGSLWVPTFTFDKTRQKTQYTQ
jgi:hypothetical protein